MLGRPGNKSSAPCLSAGRSKEEVAAGSPRAASASSSSSSSIGRTGAESPLACRYGAGGGLAASPRRDGTGRGGRWAAASANQLACLRGGGGGLRIRPQPTEALPPFLFEQYYFTHSSPVWIFWDFFLSGEDKHGPPAEKKKKLKHISNIFSVSILVTLLCKVPLHKWFTDRSSQKPAYFLAESMLTTQLREESRIDQDSNPGPTSRQKASPQRATGITVNMGLDLPPWNNEGCHAI